MFTTGQVERNIKEIDNFLVGFDRYFKAVLAKDVVGLGRIVIFCCDSRLVGNRFLETIAIHRALSWSSAVTCFRRHDLFAQNRFIMPVDALFQVGHAAVADLNCVTIKDLM